MLVTCHVSVTPPMRLRDYHIEFGLVDSPSNLGAINAMCKAAQIPSDIDWVKLKGVFNVWKNVALVTPTSYGTYKLNHDPRDGSSNIETAAMCLGGEGVSIAGPWGHWPYTYAHSWMHAGCVARVCQIENIDTGGSFDVSVDTSRLQNGPIYVVSTHAERAWQTVDTGQDIYPDRGYFAYSGDPDSRWDCIARDVELASVASNFGGALKSARDTATWIRHQAHLIRQGGISDFWGLDQDPT